MKRFVKAVLAASFVATVTSAAIMACCQWKLNTMTDE